MLFLIYANDIVEKQIMQLMLWDARWRIYDVLHNQSTERSKHIKHRIEIYGWVFQQMRHKNDHWESRANDQKEPET